MTDFFRICSQSYLGIFNCGIFRNLRKNSIRRIFARNCYISGTLKQLNGSGSSKIHYWANKVKYLTRNSTSIKCCAYVFAVSPDISSLSKIVTYTNSTDKLKVPILAIVINDHEKLT